MISARDLFQKLVPFLASDNEVFQEAVVFALGNINESHYLALLETMQALSGTLNDDFKVRAVARSGLKRNRRLDRLRTALAPCPPASRLLIWKRVTISRTQRSSASSTTGQGHVPLPH